MVLFIVNVSAVWALSTMWVDEWRREAAVCRLQGSQVTPVIGGQCARHIPSSEHTAAGLCVARAAAAVLGWHLQHEKHAHEDWICLHEQ